LRAGRSDATRDQRCPPFRARRSRRYEACAADSACDINIPPETAFFAEHAVRVISARAIHPLEAMVPRVAADNETGRQTRREGCEGG